MLSVVVHTEAQFDWDSSFDRSATSVEHLLHIERVQNIFETFGIRPLYVVDYSVATQEVGIKTIAPLIDSGRADIGAHLHPWVSPPFVEDVSVYNSFPGNLPENLERRKLEVLTHAIELAFGQRPRAYLAGRYGFGANTTATLKRLEYEIDLSASPPFDYSAEGGPDWSRLDCQPLWLDTERELIRLPITGALTGGLQCGGNALYSMLATRPFELLRIRGILARLRLLERIRLSPEGFTLSEMQRLTLSLLRQGTKHFLFSLHSPSIVRGGTSYVETESDLHLLLQTCTRYFDWFFRECEGKPITSFEFRDIVREHGTPSGACKKYECPN